jgi:hypothetical protein
MDYCVKPKQLSHFKKNMRRYMGRKWFRIQMLNARKWKLKLAKRARRNKHRHAKRLAAHRRRLHLNRRRAAIRRARMIRAHKLRVLRRMRA